jgi:hypothetical protein
MPEPIVKQDGTEKNGCEHGLEGACLTRIDKGR